MKFRYFVIAALAMSLAACGKASQEERSNPNVAEAVPSTEALPVYDSVGVISGLEGQILTIDHEGANAAGLKPGRDGFKVYGYVIAEPPITPGTRVTFQFRKTPEGLELSKLEPRP